MGSFVRLLLISVLVLAVFGFLVEGRTAIYTVQPAACQESPGCCCAHGDIVVKTSKTAGKINISADLSGGPNCGGKSHVSSDFDILSPTHSTFAEPGTPLQVTARLTTDFKTIAFSNNLQQCLSIGALANSNAFSFNTLSTQNTGSFSVLATPHPHHFITHNVGSPTPHISGHHQQLFQFSPPSTQFTTFATAPSRGLGHNPFSIQSNHVPHQMPEF